MEDPRRYRVEILFSPGATATPMHMDELDRDSDSTRFDTSGLEFIGRKDLTCNDVEDFFSSAIVAGQIDESEFSLGTLSPYVAESPKKPKVNKARPKDATQERSQTIGNAEVPSTVTVTTNNEAAKERITAAPKTTVKAPDKSTVTAVVIPKVESMNKKPKAVEPPIPKESMTTPRTTKKVEATSETEISEDAKKKVGDAKEGLPRKSHTLSLVEEEDEEDEDARVQRLARSLARKYFWRTIGVFSFVIGAGCLVLSMNVRTDPYSRRRWTRR
jgi:ribosomal protein L20A (L18A)